MNRDLRIILVKFFMITALVIIYVFVAVFYIAPYVTHVAFRTEGCIPLVYMMWTCVPKAYGQSFPQDQFNNQQFSQNQQLGQQQFNDPNQFNQGFNNQYQQPYQQFGTPTYMPQGQYGYPQQPIYNSNSIIEQIITAIAAAGGSMAYTKRRTSQLHDDNQEMYSEILKGKQVDAELARITYAMNQEKANQINDAPSIKLETLQKDVQDFTNKTAKA